MSANETSTVPWPSEVELELRQRLSGIEANQLRTDKLITALQLEQRQANDRAMLTMGRIEAKMDSLVALLRSNGSEHHHG